MQELSVTVVRDQTNLIRTWVCHCMHDTTILLSCRGWPSLLSLVYQHKLLCNAQTCGLTAGAKTSLTPWHALGIIQQGVCSQQPKVPYQLVLPAVQYLASTSIWRFCACSQGRSCGHCPGGLGATALSQGSLRNSPTPGDLHHHQSSCGFGESPTRMFC